MNRPTIFYSGNTVARAGHVVCVRGEYFDLNWKAAISDGRQLRPAELHQLNRQSFKVQIPADFEDGIYTLELSGQESLSVTLNTPKVRWIQGDEGETAALNGWIRFQGECLRITKENSPFAVFKDCSGVITRIFPERIYDDYSVEFSLAGLEEGDYYVTYWNGFASCDCGTFTIAPSWELSCKERIYNVTEYGLSKDSVSDCTDALNRLLARVGAEGGGVLYFPRGRYHLTGCIQIPQGIILRGDGISNTQLFWTDEWHEWKIMENSEKKWIPKELPPVMITTEGNFAAEKLEFAAGRIGRLLKAGTKDAPVKNIRLDNIRVEVNALLGVNGRHHKERYLEILQQALWDEEIDMFTIYGSNVKICSCRFNWPGRFMNFDNKIEYLLFRNVFAGNVNSLRCWMPIGELNRAIVEDNEIHGWDVGYSGDNVYMARTRIQDTVCGDREAFTTDIRTGIPYCGPARIDGCRFIFPDHADLTRARPGSRLCILWGTGAGQYRRVKEIDGQTVTIEGAFEVPPDEQSYLTINYMFTNFYFVDMVIENGGMMQFYVAQGNTVIDGAKITRSAGIQGYGQFTYRGVQNNWYNSYVNNDISADNYYHCKGWYFDNKFGRGREFPGYASLFVMGRFEGPITLCPVIRGNTLRNNAVYLIYSSENGSISDPVIDSNHSVDCRCGIYVEGKAERLLLTGNTFERVDEELHFDE